MSRPISLIPAAVAFVALAPTFVGAQQAGTRSPGAAGVLSFFYPGTGSYYAGNIGHDTRHAVLGIVLGTAWSTGMVLSCHDGDCSDGAGKVVAIGGLGVVAVHRLWAIVEAVTDAHAYQRRATPESRIDARPAPVVLGSGASSLGIRLASIRF